MRIYRENDNCSNKNNTKMSNFGLDIRLRRQIPVTAKPPRLRLGIRTSTLQQQQQQIRRNQQDVYSWPISFRGATHEPPTSVGGGSASIRDKWFQTQSVGSSGNNQNSVSNGKRPIIHHQRHNLKNRFQLLKTLGEGTYGKVKLASDKATGEHVAIKYIKKTKIEDENDLNRIRREIQILSSLRHKHIVNIREVFEKKDKIVLVLDYAQGGELYDYLNRMGKLTEIEARRIFRQIVSAIHCCHQNGIVHRDLKLENIILDDQGNVKIADFGLSNYYSHNSTLKTFCGSPLYASPEIVNGKPYHGPEVDVWSLGVILYTLVYGSMPFESNNLVSLKQQISEGDYSQPSKLSDAAGLIRHMLTVTPSRRATIEDALRHWWINFGHTHMPNDMVYSPDDEPPAVHYSLAPEKDTQNDPPVAIHHRNQSSISSDSDVELDFRPNRWSLRTISLDSTGNSVSSSVAGSPAPTPDSYRHSVQDNSDDAAIASGLLKLPPDVLEILKGCSSKSLAALLNNDKISSDFHLDNNVNNNNASSQNNAQENTEESPGLDKMSSTVFDSERKPKRGILKRKGKFSGSDNRSVMPEEMIAKNEDNAIPKSGHLPRRLPSFKDEAHGIFVSKHRASQLLDHASDSPFHDSCNSAISHSAWSNPSSRLFRDQPHQQHSHQIQTVDNMTSMQAPDNMASMQAPDNMTSMPASDNMTFMQTQHPQLLSQMAQMVITDVTPSICNGNAPSELKVMPTTSEYHQEDGAKLPSGDLPCDNTSLKEQPVRVVYRPKSILKKSSFDDGRNRLSVSSIGSNSSADILDLSYDSGDSDHFVNQGLESSPDSDINYEDGTDIMKMSEQRSYSFDEELLKHEISGTSSDQTYSGRHRSRSEENRQLQDSSPSILYRLTIDAQSQQ